MEIENVQSPLSSADGQPSPRKSPDFQSSIFNFQSPIHRGIRRPIFPHKPPYFSPLNFFSVNLKDIPLATVVSCTFPTSGAW
jgi:hypothetical protein